MNVRVCVVVEFVTWVASVVESFLVDSLPDLWIEGGKRDDMLGVVVSRSSCFEYSLSTFDGIASALTCIVIVTAGAD